MGNLKASFLILLNTFYPKNHLFSPVQRKNLQFFFPFRAKIHVNFEKKNDFLLGAGAPNRKSFFYSLLIN